MKKYSDNKPMNAKISIDYKQSEVYFSYPQRMTKRRECKEKGQSRAHPKARGLKRLT